MDLIYAAKMKRPDGVSENDPISLPLHNPLPLLMRVRWVTGGVYKNLATCSKWVTVKSDLTDLDSAAEIALESGGVDDPFVIVDSARGLLKCTITSSYLAALVVGTLYHIDVQLSEAGEPYTILYDTFRLYQPVTKARV